MDGVVLTPLKQVFHPKGDIFHAMKNSDIGFYGFGEAYFSTIKKGEIKGWKKHNKMVINLVIVIGEIEIVVFNAISKEFFHAKLSMENYQRLTVAPGLWVAFRGIEDQNILLNLASIEHDPQEADNIELSKIKYDWKN